MIMMMKMCSRKMYSVLLLLVIGFIVLNDRMANALPKQEKTERELVQLINKIDNEVSLPLFGGMRIDRSENGRAFGSVKSVESFEQRAERYLQTHTLSFSFPEEEATLENEMDDENTGRSMAEESRGKKMKKMLVPLLLALKLKKAVILKVLFMVIKFISLKSLAISLLALFFAGATFFKDLFGKKKEHFTTAYITGSPLNAEIVHSDWNRNGQASASELAYNHYGLAQPF